MFDEIRYAVRSWLASPAFTFVAVVTLALGIGASTAIALRDRTDRRRHVRQRRCRARDRRAGSLLSPGATRRSGRPARRAAVRVNGTYQDQDVESTCNSTQDPLRAPGALINSLRSEVPMLSSRGLSVPPPGRG